MSIFRNVLLAGLLVSSSGVAFADPPQIDDPIGDAGADFMSWDWSGDGYLDYGEFRGYATGDLGWNNSQAAGRFGSADTNRDGKLDIHEFWRCINDWA